MLTIPIRRLLMYRKTGRLTGLMIVLVLGISLCACSCSKGTTAIDPDGDGSGLSSDYKVNVLVPETPGTVVYSGNGVSIDASNVNDGYVAVKCEPKSNRLKAQVMLEDHSYNYDIDGDNQYVFFPLQMGNGMYKVRVLENAGGTNYTPLYQADIDVSMDDTNRVFIYPSQYVWYTNETSAVAKSYEICDGLKSDEEKVEAIYDWVVDNMTYDKELAKTVESGYLPDLEVTMKTKKGICFDYCALFSAMLRAQGIPTKLVIGKVQPENITHSWSQVYLDGKWKWMDTTMDGKGHKESDYTMEKEY